MTAKTSASGQKCDKMTKLKLTDSQWVARRLRAARALMDIDQQELATGADLDLAIITDAEDGTSLPIPTDWAKIPTFVRANGIRPTEYGIEFDPDLIEPPERARQRWSHKVMKDPIFPDQ